MLLRIPLCFVRIYSIGFGFGVVALIFFDNEMNEIMVGN